MIDRYCLEADGALALELSWRRFYELTLVSRFLFNLSRRLLVAFIIIAAGGWTSHFSRTKRAYLSLLFPMRMRSKVIPPRQSCEDKVIFTNETLQKIVKIIVDTSPVEGKLQRHEMDMIKLKLTNDEHCANYTNVYNKQHMHRSHCSSGDMINLPMMNTVLTGSIPKLCIQQACTGVTAHQVEPLSCSSFLLTSSKLSEPLA